MTSYISLKDIQVAYKKAVEDFISTNLLLTPDAVIQLSIQLYNNIKVPGASDEIYPDNDILLFQYGTYDWGDENGKHVNFDITRQFILSDNSWKNDPEFYQLRFSLNYDAEALAEADGFNCWSNEFTNLQDWVIRIKSTRGYEILKTKAYKSYEIFLTRV